MACLPVAIPSFYRNLATDTVPSLYCDTALSMASCTATVPTNISFGHLPHTTELTFPTAFWVKPSTHFLSKVLVGSLLNTGLKSCSLQLLVMGFYEQK